MGAMTTPCRESPIRGGNGYGKHRNQQGLHRWVMEQVHGADAIRGRSVMHLCDNPACFRFDHLAIGLQKAGLLTATPCAMALNAEAARYYMMGRSNVLHGAMAKPSFEAER